MQKNSLLPLFVDKALWRTRSTSESKLIANAKIIVTGHKKKKIVEI